MAPRSPRFQFSARSDPTWRRLAVLLQLGLAFQGGPVSAFTEAWEHAHQNGARHGHLVHFEAQGGQGHDDACLAWLPPAGKAPVARRAVPAPIPASIRIRAVSVQAKSAGRSTLQPPSRAPPPLA